MKAITFSPGALIHLDEWRKGNPKMLAKIVSLINAISSSPFTGIGKPEPLKGNFSGKWSRRINDEYRIVYEVRDTTILILTCMNHY